MVAQSKPQSTDVPTRRGKAAPVTRIVGRWLASLGPGSVPEDVRARLRLLVLDTIGAALSGAREPWTLAIAKLVAREAPAPRPTGLATIWGQGEPTATAGQAALVNGAAAHAFELDDYHNSKLHPGAVVIPAAIALAEARGISGERLETAIAAGYEVMIRTSLALDPSEARRRGWHLTAVCGTLGAAAAATVLLGLDAERTQWALGLAGTQSGGLFAFNADGTMSKRLHPGRAAQAGIMAAELAELGFTGPTQVYEAEDGGLLWAFSSQSRTEPLIEDLGERWHAADTSFKPYSCCGSLHTYVDCAIALRPKWRPGARVRTGVAKVVDMQCGYPYQPGSELNAQMSIRYAIAVALKDGAALPPQFTPQRIADADLTALAQSIEVSNDPEQDKLYPAKFSGWVEIEREPGSNQFERDERTNPSGHPQNPNREAALRAKFCTLVTPLVGEAAARRIEAASDDLGHVRPAELVGMLVLPKA
jgi:2-methylcitrate dehydratase PrpD